MVSKTIFFHIALHRSSVRTCHISLTAHFLEHRESVVFTEFMVRKMLSKTDKTIEIRIFGTCINLSNHHLLRSMNCNIKGNNNFFKFGVIYAWTLITIYFNEDCTMIILLSFFDFL